MAERIDSDNNGEVNEDELTLWIRNIERQHIANDTKRVWNYYNKDPTQTIDWIEYADTTFGEFRGNDLVTKLRYLTDVLKIFKSGINEPKA